MESKAHIDLVNRVLIYVKERIPESSYELIHCDSNGRNSEVRVMGNFVPDIYYTDGDVLIIGEAKTLDDFERKHSRDQFDAYIKECQIFSGTSMLIVAVPWQLMITAKNYFKRLKQRESWSFDVVIINDMGKVMELE